MTQQADSILGQPLPRLLHPQPFEAQPAQLANHRAQKIDEFTKSLSIVKNACEPLNGYLKFQQCLTPEIRTLIALNYSILVMNVMKGVAKGALDWQFMDIRDPPETLKEGLTKAYSDIDGVVTTFENSMKDVVALIQPKSKDIPAPHELICKSA